MAKSASRIILSASKDIARCGLLQGLSVRAVLDDNGSETGLYEIPAGGRRFQALALLVKQRPLARTAPIPCILRETGSDILAEDDSLAENLQRVALHPLDQFRAFVVLHEKGQDDEATAAAFFVTPQMVKQRLKLAAVAPALLDIYAEDGMTLEQLMTAPRTLALRKALGQSLDGRPDQRACRLSQTATSPKILRASWISSTISTPPEDSY